MKIGRDYHRMAVPKLLKFISFIDEIYLIVGWNCIVVGDKVITKEYVSEEINSEHQFRDPSYCTTVKWPINNFKRYLYKLN